MISSPEQSIPDLEVPPHLYGVPVYDLADCITWSIFLALAFLELAQLPKVNKINKSRRSP